MAPHNSLPHRWYTPADCAALLLGMGRNDTYRAPCPVCRSERTDSLSIRLRTDQHGNPMTVLHCFAHDCPRAAVCAEMGIEVANLYCMRPEYYQTMRHFPPAKSKPIAKLRRMEEPTPDEIAQILLEEMIVSDPEWIQTCEPAREKMWELAQASPKTRAALTRALQQAHLQPVAFWDALAQDMNG